MTRWRRNHVITLQCLLSGIFLGAITATFFTGGPWGHSPSQQEMSDALWVRKAMRDTRWGFVMRNRYNADDSTQADALLAKVKILCYVILPADQVPAKRRVYKRTWGKRCDHLLLFTNRFVDDETVVLNIAEPDHVEEDAMATMHALRHLYQHHLEHAQWFLRLHPMTFVVLENLRYFLRDEDHTQPIYFGQSIRDGKVMFPFGFGGYVMSKEALAVLGAREDEERKCRDTRLPECVVIGKCFQALGIRFGDSRDAADRSRFHGISVESIAVHDYQAWFHDLDPYDHITSQGVQSVSDNAITFSPISDGVILAMEYYLYTARVYGRAKPSLEVNKREVTT